MAKVRVKATGEILDFASDSLIAVHCPGTPETDEREYSIGEVEVIPDGSSSERMEFAKAAMQALLLRGRMTDTHLAKRSFEIADAMVKQLEK